MGEKVGKSRNTVFFQWFGAPEGQKVGSLKRRVRSQRGSCDVEKVHAVVARSTFWSQNVQNTPFSDHFWKLRCWKSARRRGAKQISRSKCTKHHMFAPLLEVEMLKKRTPLWREAHFEVKMYKTHHSRTTFGSWDVEKVHAVVARSTFWRPQRRALFQHLNFQKWREHVVFCTFWPGNLLRATTACTFSTSQLPKVVREWCVLYILTSKCASLQMYKTHQVRTTFGSWDVEKVHAVVARSTFPSQNVQNTTCSRDFWSSDVEKVHAVVARSTFPSRNVQNTTCSRMFAPLLEVRMLKKCALLWREAHFQVKMYKTPHVRATFGGSDVEKVHAVVARSTFPSQNVQKHTRSGPLFFGGSDVASLQYTTLQDITLHYTPVRYITLHYTPVHSTTLNYTTPHYITLNDTATQIDR